MVVDASLAVAWCLRDEQTAATIALLDRAATEGILVPALWHLELANVLRMAVRRQRISREQRDRSIDDLRSLPTTVDGETEARAWSETQGLADKYDLTTYDAAYLELAIRRKLPFATLDRQLADAARREAVDVLPGGADP